MLHRDWDRRGVTFTKSPARKWFGLQVSSQPASWAAAQHKKHPDTFLRTWGHFLRRIGSNWILSLWRMQINIHLLPSKIQFCWQVVRVVGSECQEIRGRVKLFKFPVTGSRFSAHLKDFSGPEDALDAVLVKIGDTLVHELEQDLEILMVGSLQDNDELAIESGVGK